MLFRYFFVDSQVIAAYKDGRNSWECGAGAYPSSAIHPRCTSSAVPRMADEYHRPFHVWGRHSCRESGNEGLFFLSAVSCEQKSPALTGPLSTGNRRSSETCRLAIPSREAPNQKAGEKGASV